MYLPVEVNSFIEANVKNKTRKKSYRELWRFISTEINPKKNATQLSSIKMEAINKRYSSILNDYQKAGFIRKMANHSDKHGSCCRYAYHNVDLANLVNVDVPFVELERVCYLDFVDEFAKKQCEWFQDLSWSDVSKLSSRSVNALASFWCKEDEYTGRLSSSFTQIPREDRPFLRFRGEELVDFDIKSAVPMGLAIATDDDQLKEAVLKGSIYRDFLEDSQPEIDRYYGEVWFCLNWDYPYMTDGRTKAKKSLLAWYNQTLEAQSKNPADDFFRRMFPNHYSFVKSWKQLAQFEDTKAEHPAHLKNDVSKYENHAVSQYAQWLEVNTFFHDIVIQYAKTRPVFAMLDGAMVPASDKDGFRQFFDKHNHFGWKLEEKKLYGEQLITIAGEKFKVDGPVYSGKVRTLAYKAHHEKWDRPRIAAGLEECKKFTQTA